MICEWLGEPRDVGGDRGGLNTTEAPKDAIPEALREAPRERAGVLGDAGGGRDL